MLHRSFKPAKCKTVLKLAMARIKLLKNKKEVVYKQQKREVAQLLESGDDRTARIRVEHVIREEKTMAAYELIEIYCELIVARLSMVETQKNCPIDLKEAITSVMFASPRCAADIPELVDIRKHFTTKYGKEFVSSAVELRPNAGVNRLLVEKLSATAPDTQTKIKVMTTIAEEHNIKWEPSVGEKDEKPVDELLSGPKTFENVNKIHVEPSVMQAASSFHKKQDVPVYHSEQNTNSSIQSENFASAGVDTSKTTPDIPHPEPRPSPNSDGREREHSLSGDRNDSSPGKQSWDMEFKDATSAAQAAAEAAERACMAARAAVEFSNRENTRTSNFAESQKLSIPRSQDECQPSYSGPTLRSEDPPKKYGNNSFHGTTSGQTIDQEDEDDEYNLAAETAKLRCRPKKSSHSASVKSSSYLIVEDLPGKSSQNNKIYSQMSSPKVGPAKSKSGDYSDEEAVNEKFHEGSRKQDADRNDVINSFVEEMSGKQAGGGSSRSHSSTSSDHEKFTNDENPNHFGDICRGDILKAEDAEQVQSYDHHGQVFDNTDSDEDNGGFDKDVFGVKNNFFPSPDRETPTHLSEDAYILDSISTKSYFFKDADTPEISISHSNSNVLAGSDELQRVAFDHSDGPGSETEEELVQLKHNASPKKQISPRIVTSQLDFDEINRFAVYDKFDEEKSSQSSTHSSVHETVNIVEVSETPDEMRADDFVKLSSFEDHAESSFGVLTGGRLNKPKILPYNPMRSYSDISSDSDSDDFVTTSSKNQSKVDDTQLPPTSKGRSTSGVVSRRTRAGIADKSSYSDQMKAFLEGSGDGSSSSVNANEKASFNEQERSKPAHASSSKRPHEEKLKTSSFGKPVPEFKDRKQEERLQASSYEKPRSREQARPKYEDEVPTGEERFKTSAYEKPRSRERARPKYEDEVPTGEERFKTSSYEKPRSRERARPIYEDEVQTGEERFKTSAYEKPRSRERAMPKYEDEVPTGEERFKTSAYEKPRSRERAMPKYEDEVPTGEESFKTFAYEKPRSRERAMPKYEDEVPTGEESFKTSAYEKTRSMEQASPKYEQEVNTPRRAIEKTRSREQVRPEYEEVISPKPEGRLKTSAYEKPRSREQASPKYEQEVSSPKRDNRLKAPAVEKPRSREQQARPKYEQELNIPALKREERPKTSVLETPPSPVSEKLESVKTSTSTSSKKIPEKQNSIKRASHVHPKLPDFDTIVAQFKLKRSNQK